VGEGLVELADVAELAGHLELALHEEFAVAVPEEDEDAEAIVGADGVGGGVRAIGRLDGELDACGGEIGGSDVLGAVFVGGADQFHEGIDGPFEVVV